MGDKLCHITAQQKSSKFSKFSRFFLANPKEKIRGCEKILQLFAESAVTNAET